jgi:hypothetical protein
VRLTATPAKGSTFVGWSGAVSGADPTVTLVMDGNESAIATFNLTPTPPTSGFPTDLPTGNYSISCSGSMSALTCSGFTTPGFSIPTINAGPYALTASNFETFKAEVEAALNAAVSAVQDPAGCGQSLSYSSVADSSFTITLTVQCTTAGCSGGVVTISELVQKQ